MTTKNKITLYKKYFFYILCSLILTTIFSFIGTYLLRESLLQVNNIGLIIINFITIIFFIFSKGNLKKIMFFLFCTIEGLTLAPILLLYTNTELGVYLLLTFVTILISGLIGFFTKKDLSFLGKILFNSLLCLIFYILLSIFIPLPTYGYFGVLIFSLYIIYDMNTVKNLITSGEIYSLENKYDLSKDDLALNFAMEMYLDILNLFMSILEIFGDN